MSNDVVLIRLAIAADCNLLLSLIFEHAAYERASATIEAVELCKQLQSTPPDILVFVACQDSALIGYAALTFDYALWRGQHFGHLDCLFVRESARGLGIGKKLFWHVVSVAAESGADRLEWQTPAWNRNAIRFYEREGAIASQKSRFHLTCAPAQTSPDHTPLLNRPNRKIEL